MKQEQIMNKYRVRMIQQILIRHDPIYIHSCLDPDEYDIVAGTILPRISEVTSIFEVRAIIHQELIRWFSIDLAGLEKDYSDIALEVWGLFHNDLS